ncbi:hypothetical protein ACFQ1A_29025, partial [Massilia pinisoli]|uniref:hypothetical protein n=1 Tax=Massilia pinisoli TaxID=1772194 RepID=UPI003624DEB1
RNDIKKINFILKWEDTLKSIPRIIKLADLQEGYIIDKGWEEERINSKNILLAKSTTYIIVTYGGDVASYDVMITTDAKGKVVSTSHGSCD